MTENPTINIVIIYKDNTNYETLFDYIGVFEDNLDSCSEIQDLTSCIISNIEFCLFPDKTKNLKNIESIELKFITKDFIATYKNINFRKMKITFDLDFVESYYQKYEDVSENKGHSNIDFILDDTMIM